MKCRAWYVPRVPVRLDLGWFGFCERCMVRYTAACMRRYGRLPDIATEFYCPYCRQMRAHPGDRSSPETDGRVRIKCHLCRRKDWRRRWHMARAREMQREARG